MPCGNPVNVEYGFSPEGLLPEVELAFKAIEREDVTAVALKTTNCAVVATQKKSFGKYVVAEGATNLFHIDQAIGCCLVGRMGDAHYQMHQAKHIAHLFEHDSGYPIPVDVLCPRVANHTQVFIQTSLIRVPGCCMILIAYDDETGPTIFMTDPGANSSGFKACAAGTHWEKANKYLEQKYRCNVSQNKAIQLAINCLAHARCNGSEPEIIEVGVVSQCNPNFRILTDRELDECLTNVD